MKITNKRILPDLIYKEAIISKDKILMCPHMLSYLVGAKHETF